MSGDVIDIIDDVIANVTANITVSNEIKSNKELYVQVTARFVHFQKDGKKPDIEIMQSKNNEQKINVKNVQQNPGGPCSLNVVNERMLLGSAAHLIDDNQKESPDVRLDVLGPKERNHINVMLVNKKDMNGRSEEPSQNLQEIDNLLETNPDDNNVNSDKLKPTMHPGGISLGSGF